MKNARLGHKLAGHNNLVILDAHWFNATGVTGVVVCEDKITNEIKVYIDAITRKNNYEIEDAERVILHGPTFQLKQQKISSPIWILMKAGLKNTLSISYRRQNVYIA